MMKFCILKIVGILIFMVWSVTALGLDKEERAAIKAIERGDLDRLSAYLDEHPGANCEFSNGKTGLFYAIVYDEVRVSEFLLRSGADPNLTVTGFSTLKWAITYNRGRIARLLIEYGGDVNRPDEHLMTPLIFAADLDNLEMCKILIDRGADPWHTDRKGKRASDHAFNHDRSALYNYLVSMEEQCKIRDSIPSMQEGPYIYWEADDRIVITYYEHSQDQRLTRMIERTIWTGPADTVMEGIGRDTNSYHIKHTYVPDPYEVITAGNIFVVGDIHGKYSALVILLMNNKVIDSNHLWIFGNGHLVLLGDVFDRGASVTETLWLLHELQIQALSSGGNVHLLLGNHEIMALTGDHRYLNDKYNYFTHYTRTDYYQLFEKNSVLGRWLRSQNIILRINDYLFAHAGISPQFAVLDYAYSDVNSRVQNYLWSDYWIEKGSPEEMILGAFGPLWYRGYMNSGKNSPEVTQQFVDEYIRLKGLRRMILGHNEESTITTSFGGKIISADVALDESGRSSQGLLISGDQVYRCFSDGLKEPIE